MSALRATAIIIFLFFSGYSAFGTGKIPLPEFTGLASSFGEYRGSRLHAGIDFRCGEREGVPVTAVHAGRIVRLRASRYGYGKNLYIQGSSGRIEVYAHLSSFENKSLQLEDLLAEARRTAGRRYPIDFMLPEGRQPAVLADQVIGFTGKTGSGGVHLHFEIRSDFVTAINPVPFVAGIEKDHYAPVFKSLVFIPSTPGALANGLPLPLEVPLTAGPDGLYCAPSPVHLTEGSFRLLANITDRGISPVNLMGAKSLFATIDGRPFFMLDFNSFDLSESDFGIIYDTFRTDYKNYYYNLTLPDNCNHNGCIDFSQDSLEFLSEPNRLVIMASDFFENHATAEIFFSETRPDSACFTGITEFCDRFLIVPDEFPRSGEGDFVQGNGWQWLIPH
ncbi:MAG: M23 family metallopeptidase, partial [Candidatus Wallbacteria bacterium]|nr:M23 family metallopeptidase [Candidatus Wallbacteria bacterium]